MIKQKNNLKLEFYTDDDENFTNLGNENTTFGYIGNTQIQVCSICKFKKHDYYILHLMDWYPIFFKGTMEECIDTIYKVVQGKIKLEVGEDNDGKFVKALN
jgi:hypothetical protein